MKSEKSKKVKENLNRDFEQMLGISYDQFDKLDFDEQQRLISEYHKKNPSKKSKDTLVMIGGESETYKRVSKGDRVKTKDGFFIAGETPEENKKRWEQELEETDKRLEKINDRLEKEIKKSTKLDFETWLYLYITHAIRVEHPPVIELESKRTMYVKNVKKNEIYVFKDYDEYKNYFLMYLNSIEEELIDLAIYTRGSKGQIVALKGLCEHIIVKRRINDFYNSITKEQINEIHAKGKLTPLEAVQMWESLGLCIEGRKSIILKNRCQYFDYNCHECLMESASHKLEYDPVEFEEAKKTSTSTIIKTMKKTYKNI